MLNYIKADLYRIFSKTAIWIWSLVFVVLVPLLVFGAGTQYGKEQILYTTPLGIYILFMFVSLVLSEYVFREDKQIGVFKNDTTSGISRSDLFLSKYFTGVILEIVLWFVCSTATVLVLLLMYGTEHATTIFRAFFSLRAIGWLLTNLMYLAIFQVISIYVKKTSALLLVCVAVSAFISNVETILLPVFPSLNWLFQSAFETGNTVHVTIMQIIPILAVPFIGTALLLTVGCILFQKSEF